MTVIGCRYDSHWLQIWQSLVADMTYFYVKRGYCESGVTRP